jgi:hypothetical protein
VRLSAQGRTTEFEVGRREALHLEPALGDVWFDGFAEGADEPVAEEPSEEKKE